jgi:hypothetical protein
MNTARGIETVSILSTGLSSLSSVSSLLARIAAEFQPFDFLVCFDKILAGHYDRCFQFNETWQWN